MDVNIQAVSKEITKIKNELNLELNLDVTNVKNELTEIRNTFSTVNNNMFFVTQAFEEIGKAAQETGKKAKSGFGDKVKDVCSNILPQVEGAASKIKEGFGFAFNSLSSEILEKDKDLEGFWNNLKDFKKGDIGILKLVDSLSEMELGKIGGESITEFIQGLTGGISQVLDTGTTIIQTLSSSLSDSLPDILVAGVEMLTTLMDGIIDTLPLLSDIALEIIPKLINGISESLPTLIPKAAEVLITIVQTLINMIPMLIGCALDLIVGLAEGIIQAIPVIIEALPTLIGSLIAGLLGAIPQIINAGVDLLVSLVKNVPTIIVEVVKAIPQIITGIIEAIISLHSKIIETGSTLLKKIWDGMLEGAEWLFGKIKGFFGGIVEKIKDLVGSIAQPFKKLFGGDLKGAAEGFVNLLIKGINFFVKGLMSPFDLLIKAINIIPGVNLPMPSKILQIPMVSFAEGGIVTAPTFGLIGEGRYHEAVIPLGGSPQMRELVANVADAASSRNGNFEQNQIWLDQNQISLEQNSLLREEIRLLKTIAEKDTDFKVDGKSLLIATDRARKERGLDLGLNSAFAR
ncbi:MAG: hypothetical protein LBI03_03215 [Clostridiales bacterium]|jgi:phage-related protein|nr:hypothetical protein [Clostridiales bacterium]